MCNILQVFRKYDEYSDSIPPQNYDWTICLLAKTVSKGKINEPLLYSFDGKYTFRIEDDGTFYIHSSFFLFVRFRNDCIKIAGHSEIFNIHYHWQMRFWKCMHVHMIDKLDSSVLMPNNSWFYFDHHWNIRFLQL